MSLFCKTRDGGGEAEDRVAELKRYNHARAERGLQPSVPGWLVPRKRKP